nr:hypothetical protein [Candidatus Njordarchaeota archaeon]
MVVVTSKRPTKIGATFLQDNGDVMIFQDGKTSDSHFISPETSPEKFRIVGALGEMLFEQAKKSFGVDSLIVIAQNDDFKIVMFPKNSGFAVWKTNIEIEQIVREFHRSKNDQGKCSRKIESLTEGSR